MYYYSLNKYLRQQFGTKVYKLALSAKVTCPNRDGTLSNKGCIFCSAGGSGEFSSDANLSITEQINVAKCKVQSKIKNGKYIAYFQSFTNTYAEISYLREIFFEAINNADIVALSIATRPDCLGKEVISLLNELNQIKPVWIELGLQTIHEKTAKYINRCYTLAVYDSAVERLHAINISVITHIIIGLPNETKSQMIETVKYVGSLTDGIKLQLLHVLKRSTLELDYNNNLFQTLSMENYIDILADCVRTLPQNVVIHRLTGDGDKKLLVAPLWSANKKLVLNSINKYFNEHNVIQGSLVTNSKITNILP